MNTFNAVVSAALAAVLAWAVMSPAVRDGIVIKAGLIAMSLGFAGVSVMSWMQTWWALPRALIILHLGLLVLGLGYWSRTRKAGHPLRRVADFVDLEGVSHDGR